MKLRALLLPMLIIAGMVASGQRSTLELTFTAENNGVHVQLDSIRVMNRTQGGETVLYWPDTVLLIYNVGISEMIRDEGAFRVFQNYPNPAAGQTTISLYVPAKDKVSIMVTDLLGRMILRHERVLDQGVHSFQFTPGSGSLYFFTAQWKGQSSSVKILQAGFNSSPTATLEYTGSETSSPQLKAAEEVRDFVFSLGDELLCIGYAEGLQSGFLDAPEEDHSYTFDFATNIPCPETPMVEYEGQVYNTIQVFSQCWLKENLNIGVMIQGTMEQSNNGTIEKYCYNNEPDSCTKYGGLYQWNEMMQYTTQQGAQGICPPGWRLPTDEEWKVLEGAADSQYGIGDPEWDIYWEYRGYDAGTNLKTISGWYENGNGTDLFGFSGLPGGSRYDIGGAFTNVGIYGDWWSSMESSYGGVWGRGLSFSYPEVHRGNGYEEVGFSVRCLRDEPFSAEVPAVITAEVTAVTQTSAVCGGNVVADGGAYVTARGVVWSQTEHPTIENNQGITHNGTGTGEFVSQLTFLMPGTEYFVRAYATNSQGTAYGEDQGFTTSQPAFNCGTSTITDIDGNVYNTLLMGSQCWMKQNLKTLYDANGNLITRYCYNNDPDNCNLYGGMYNWNTVMNGASSSNNNPSGVLGICPTGWHVPSDAEWTQLVDYVAAQGFPNESDNPNGAGNALKSCRQVDSPLGGECNTTEHPRWNSHSIHHGFDEFGFSALPGGLRNSSGQSSGIGAWGGYWSSTESSGTTAWRRAMYNSTGHINSISSFNKMTAYSVRCLRDYDEMSPTAVFTADPTFGPVPLTVTFTDLSANNPTSWQWNFGDGGTSTLQHPVHIYQNTGNYTVQLTVSNSYGSDTETKTDYISVFSDGLPCPGTPTVTDIDGNVYNTVLIGNQCWMQEDLKTTNDANGNSVARYCYNNNTDWCDLYGGLYTWNTMMNGEASSNTNPSGVQGICPAGWHLPSDSEWYQLTDHIGGINYGNQLKSCRQVNSPLGGECNTTEHPRWDYHETNYGTDDYGFSALPAGDYYNGAYSYIGYFATFWTCTQYDSNRAWQRYLNVTLENVFRDNAVKDCGFSVRCVKD